MSSVSRNSPFVFQHVFRCGGTSFLESLRAAGVKVVRDDPPPAENPADMENFLANPLDPSAMQAPAIIAGRFAMDLTNPALRYPGLPLILMLRHPLERALSTFCQCRFFGNPIAENASSFLDQISNRMCSQVARDQTLQPGQILDQFAFVGICEYLHESVRLFASESGIEIEHVPHLRAVPRGKFEIDSNALARFEAANARDLQLYESAHDRLDRLHRSVFDKPLPEAPNAAARRWKPGARTESNE